MAATGSTRGSAAGVLAVVVLGLVIGAVVDLVGPGFADLDVYRWGGRAVFHQVPLYGARDPLHHYPFTYPPIAAVLLAPLALAPSWIAAAVWTGASAGALAVTVVLARRERGRPSASLFVLVGCVLSLALEPVWQNFWFGQINLILMVAVLVDLLRPDRRTAGILIGVAAAIKLTPLVFVVLLVLIGRRATAVRAMLTFAGSVPLGLIAFPGASAYWGERLVDPARVGPPWLAHNQSVTGALARILHEPPPTWLWLIVAGPIALGAVLVAAAWWRRGDRVLGAGIGALAMLIASPVSWSHHWVWVVPVALALWERNRTAATLWVTVFVTRPMVWLPWGERREFGWHRWDHVVGNAYLVAALALIIGTAFALRVRTDADGQSPSGSQLPVP